jgi:dipeptidyl aminopeptidase/acylaminoacyl peptidase
MMRTNLTFLLLLLGNTYSFSQKKVITSNFSDSWPEIARPIISDDGKYTVYQLLSTKGNSLRVQAVNNKWEKDLGKATDPIFTKDGKQLFFRTDGDSMGILDIYKDTVYYSSNVIECSTPLANDRWLIYRLTKPESKIIVFDLIKRKEIIFFDFDSYIVISKVNLLILKKNVGQNTALTQVDLVDGKKKYIGNYFKPYGFVSDKAGKKIAFLESSGHEREFNIRYFKSDMDSAKILISSTDGKFEGVTISDLGVMNNISGFAPMFFSERGDKFFFTFRNRYGRPKIVDPNRPNVNIRNYQDDSLKSLLGNSRSLAMVDIEHSGQVKILTKGNYAEIVSINEANNANELLIQSNIIGYPAEYKWRASAIPDLYLINIKTGSKKILLKEALISSYSFSVAGKFALWFDRAAQHWFTYNVITGIIKNVSKNIPSPLSPEQYVPDLGRGVGIAGWIKNDKSLLIYDRYDIWSVDPNGNNPPMNLTHGFGAKNRIRFRYLDCDRNHIKSFHEAQDLILSAFSEVTKEDGFFKLSLKNQKLQKLIMSPSLYTPKGNSDLDGLMSSMVPIKAKDASCYILKIMSATEYPNLYTTNDFKSFNKLSKFVPHKTFNWLTSELIHWSLPNGKVADGILYKPENFDSTKKYPVIFYYYQQNSESLNNYLQPELSNAQLNIPVYTSNGYLVFVPDITYQIGYPGESAFEAVYSAAIYLSSKPWVNAKKLGLQGHSYGGYETNYIVTKTSLFSAAVSAAGFSELPSVYNNIDISNETFHWFFEVTMGRIGASLWETPELFLSNSPLFAANKISTPILLVSGKHDNIVPYYQATEFYSALLRLQKKAWLITYEDAQHSYDTYAERLDYSIRMMQFFDHFLKDKPAPKWITGNYNPSIDNLEIGYQADSVNIP